MGDYSAVYIVIPAYNEEDNIEQCVNDWYPVVEKHGGGGNSRLVIINDGSNDNTYDIMQKLAEARPLFIPLTKDNGGHGSTVLFGYRYAIRHGADFIFQTDSDGQTNPAEFEAFWEKRNEFDAILGNRIVRGDGKSRKFIENTVCLLLKIIFDVRVEDANAPFRLMKTALVSKYIDLLPRNFNIPNIMFTTYFVRFHEKVEFIPISFKPRQGGTNSINARKIIKIGMRAVKDFYKLKKEMPEYD
ncbi:MAG: glycosyltransferase family 2 protein [Ruminococcaceae bacterium]|nr:glycosyltransferase family 2 protein [Oscillospiraceae bacterium]